MRVDDDDGVRWGSAKSFFNALYDDMQFLNTQAIG